MEQSISSIQLRIQGQGIFQSKLRLRIGQQPQYIQPKSRLFGSSEPDILSQSQFNSSIAVPKFHTPSLGESMIFSKPQKNQKNTEIAQDIQYLNAQKEKILSKKIILVYLIIFLLYLLGSVQVQNKKITGFHIIDCVGNVISFIFLVFTLYSKKILNSLSQILQIWSIILTLAFLLYPVKNQADQIFLQIISILRCLRMTFPLFINESAYNLGKKFINVIYKTKKIMFFAIIMCFLVGLFGYQLYSDTIGNRCRTSQTGLIVNQWNPADNRLCGHRSCQSNFYCKNPRQIGLQLQQKQRQMRQFGQGLLKFDSALDSAISIFQMYSLGCWGKISQMYFDVFPAWISVPFFVTGFFIFQNLLTSLIIIFFDMDKQKKEQTRLLTQKFQRKSFKDVQVVNQDFKQLQKNTSFNKILSCNSIYLQQKTNNQLEQVEKANIQIQKSKISKSRKIMLYSLVVVLSMTHIALASQFGLHPDDISEDIFNRRIGIALVVFFVLQFMVLCLMGYQYVANQDEQAQNLIQTSSLPAEIDDGMSQKQTIATVYHLEILIFFVHLVDYLVRMYQGKYILEQTSGITGMSHFVLVLRLYYLFLAMIDIFQLRNIKYQINTVIKTLKSVFQYTLIIVIMSTFFGVISHNIKFNSSNQLSLLGLIVQINRFFVFLTKNSWQNLFRFINSQNIMEEQSLYVSILGTLCVIFSAMVFMKYILSHLINEAFWQYSQVTKGFSDKLLSQSKPSTKIIKQNSPGIKINRQPPSNGQDDNQTQVLKNQKSFYIFSYQGSLRQFALSIVKNKYYQQMIRLRFYIVYVAVNIVSCHSLDTEVYAIISTVFEGFVLLDIVLEGIALRLFGRFSYTQNNIIPVLHLIFTFLVIVLSLVSVFTEIVPLLQILRVFVILNYHQGFNQTFTFVRSVSKTVFIHILILIPIALGYTLAFMPALSIKDQNIPFGQKLSQAFKLSFVLICQKGFQMSFIFGQNNLSTLLAQLTLFMMLIMDLFVLFSFFNSLGGILISEMVLRKNKKQRQIQRKLYGSYSLLQEHKIRQRILKMEPNFKVTLYQLKHEMYASGFIYKLTSLKSFKVAKIVFFLASIACFLALNTSLTTDERISIYSFHLFFFSVELFLFICQSIAYGRNQQHFWRDLILNLIAIPGAYIGFVNPVQYSSQPSQLRIILILFNALTIVRFFKLITYFAVLKKIFKFIKENSFQTLTVAISTAFIAIAISFYLYLTLQKRQSIFQCFNSVYTGIIGGDFYSTVQNLFRRNNLSVSQEIYIFYLVVHLINIAFHNIIIAFAIFELSDYGRQNMPLSSTEYNLYNFNKYFHENQFLKQWSKIDPLGKGFVNYRQILHKSHLFLRHFSITRSPYRTYLNRVLTFKKLRLPIFQAQTVLDTQQQSKPDVHKQYVVTFYDFLLSLSKFAFKEMSTTKLISKGVFFMRNQAFNDQPVTIMNITGCFQQKMSNFSRKFEKENKKLDQFQQEWRKKTVKLSRMNLQQRFAQHQGIQGLDCVLRPTKLNSPSIYYAHRLKNRITSFLNRTQHTNELKRRQGVKHYRQRSSIA